VLGFTNRVFTAYPNACAGGGLTRDVYNIRVLRPKGYTTPAETVWTRTGLQASLNDTMYCKDDTLHTFHSQPVLVYVNDVPHICASRSGASSTSAESQISCLFLVNGSTSIRYNIPHYYSSLQNPLTVSGSAMRNTHTTGLTVTDSIWIGGYLIDIDQNGIMSLRMNESELTGTNSFLSVADVNSDGQVELIATNDTQTYIFYSNAVGGVGNPNAVWIDNMTNGGIFGYYKNSPACKGTTLTFGAYQCPHIGGCGYSNDIYPAETERLVADCGNGNVIYGSYSVNEPTVACYYPDTGAWTARIYLQDSAHQTDTDQVQTILINVIDGQTGITCNIPPTLITTPDGQPPKPPVNAEIESAWLSLLNILTGGSSAVKLIFGIILIISLLIAVAQYTTNWFILSITTGLGIVLATAIGLLPAYILILLLVGLVLFIFIVNFVTKGNQDGG